MLEHGTFRGFEVLRLVLLEVLLEVLQLVPPTEPELPGPGLP